MNTKFSIFKQLHTASPGELSLQDNDGNTTFHLMAKENLQTLFTSAYQNEPAGAAIVNNYGQYPIHTAILTRQPSMVEFLLTTYPDMAFLADTKGDTALHYAARYSSADMVRQCCISNPLRVNVLNGEGETPLMVAVKARNIHVLQMLIDHSADIALANYEGASILHKAIETESVAIIKWVLEHIDDKVLNHSNEKGRTPLAHLRHCYRTRFEFLETVEDLLLDKSSVLAATSLRSG